MSEIPLRRPDYRSIPAPSDAEGLPAAIRSDHTQGAGSCPDECSAGWWQRALQAWRYSAALRELHALDARTLKDIGLHRGDLHAIADAYAARGRSGASAGCASGGSGLQIFPLPPIRPSSPSGRHPAAFRQACCAQRCGTPFAGCSGSMTARSKRSACSTSAAKSWDSPPWLWVRPGTAEIALIIRSDLQRRGLGATFLANVIKDARDAGFRPAAGEYRPAETCRCSDWRGRFGFDLVGAAEWARHNS